jgi:hypothetical protein
VAFPSIVIAGIAVLHIFLAAQRLIERAGPRLTRTVSTPEINSEGVLGAKTL